MRNEAMILKRNAKLIERYQEEYKKGFRDDVIFINLMEEFYLSEATIEKIVYGYDEKRRIRLKEKKAGVIADPNQLNIFDTTSAHETK